MMLTGEMRRWLGAKRLEEHVLLWDVVQEFRRRYRLTARQAGRLMQQWIQETC
jgi:hypothetical protein